MNTETYDVIIVGAGAADMMSAIEAGKRGRKVLLVEHSKKIQFLFYLKSHIN